MEYRKDKIKDTHTHTIILYIIPDAAKIILSMLAAKAQ